MESEEATPSAINAKEKCFKLISFIGGAIGIVTMIYATSVFILSINDQGK